MAQHFGSGNIKCILVPDWARFFVLYPRSHNSLAALRWKNNGQSISYRFYQLDLSNPGIE